MDLENNQIENSNVENDEISLKELIVTTKAWFIFLKSKLKVILLFCLIGGLVGISIAFYDKPTYKALLTFALEEDKSSSGNGLSSALGLASSLGIGIGGGGGAFAASNLTELMKSRLIVEKVLLSPIETKTGTITLADYYIKYNQLLDAANNSPLIKKTYFPLNADISKFTKEQDSILFNIYKKLINPKSLDISQKVKSVSITTIEVISNDEIFAKTFCEKLAKETSDYYIEIKSKKARLNMEILQKQVDSIRVQFNSAINKFAEASDNIYNLNPALRIKGILPAKRQIDIQINTAMLNSLVSNLEIAKMELRKETPLIQLIDPPILPLEKKQTSKAFTFLLGALIAGILSIFYLTFVQVIKKLI